MKLTKKAYEEYLNDLSPEQGDNRWIIGGTIRMAHMWQNQWGTSTRKYDPIGFQVGYNEWVKQNEGKMPPLLYSYLNKK